MDRIESLPRWRNEKYGVRRGREGFVAFKRKKKKKKKRRGVEREKEKEKSSRSEQPLTHTRVVLRPNRERRMTLRIFEDD